MLWLAFVAGDEQRERARVVRVLYNYISRLRKGPLGWEGAAEGDPPALLHLYADYGLTGLDQIHNCSRESGRQ